MTNRLSIAPAPTCSQCGAPLVTTYDALKRPRYRCPDCDGVAPAPANPELHGPLHCQTATSSRELAWPAAQVPDPTAARGLRRLGRASGRMVRAIRAHGDAMARTAAAMTTLADKVFAALEGHCARCEEPLPPQSGPGRRRKYCEDKQACAARARVLAQSAAPLDEGTRCHGA